MESKPKATSETQYDFEVQSYVIKWVSANPNYDYTYNLVPVITLYESPRGKDEEGKIAFLLFRHDDHVRGARSNADHTIFYLDFPMSCVNEVIDFIESGLALKLTYKEQDNRNWAELQTKPQPLVHPHKKK